MSNDSYIGTYYSVTYLKNTDTNRRHKARCKYYLKETKGCLKIALKCTGSSHCRYYYESQNEDLEVMTPKKNISQSRVEGAKKRNTKSGVIKRIPEDYVLLEEGTKDTNKIVRCGDIVTLIKISDKSKYNLSIERNHKASCPAKKIVGRKLKSRILIGAEYHKIYEIYREKSKINKKKNKSKRNTNNFRKNKASNPSHSSSSVRRVKCGDIIKIISKIDKFSFEHEIKQDRTQWSPIDRACIGKAVGDKFTVDGYKYELVSIS